MSGPSFKKPHLTKNGKRILCQTEHFVPLVIRGLSSSSGTSSSSTSFRQDSSTSPSPAISRSDDTYYQAPGDRCNTPNIRNQNQKDDNNRATGDSLRDIPVWLQEFIENLEDTALANASHNSDSDRLPIVASRKHSIHIPFPQDRSCEVCKRTKITRGLCKKHIGEAVPRAETLGDLITADRSQVFR